MEPVALPLIRYDDQRLLGGVPTARGLQSLAQLGVTTLVDCRTASELAGEVERPQRAAAGLGMRCYWRPLPRGSWSAGTLGALWLAAFGDPEAKVYLYSQRGLRPLAALIILDAFSRRWSLVEVAHRARARGLSLEGGHPLAQLVRQEVLDGGSYPAAMVVCERRMDLFGPCHLLHPHPRRSR